MKRLLVFFLTMLLGLAYAQEPARIIIDTEGDVHPWNMLEANNSPSTFQFAIVTDRTGGLRPGIFPVAVEKLNLLQPEFVMSVGDLITGYTEDEVRIDREWKEFTGFISKLQMPFFYVPGNHDYINDVMAKKWKERFGKDYYHFKYKDVLFLCLNTEELKRGAGKGAIDQPQYDYIKQTLAENTDVKWTLIFMHQPLWDQPDNGMWGEVEALLKDRKHTVYVGHRHRYVKYERNNSKYFILATTGGGSGLRGPAFGEFDHVVWITMTDDGPIMANLMLDGVWDENVQTEESLHMTRSLTGASLIEVKPLMANRGVFTEDTLTLKITNPANIPLEVEIEPGTHPDLYVAVAEHELEVAPNGVAEFRIPVKAMKELDLAGMKPLGIELEFTYEAENRPELVWEKELQIKPIALNVIETTPKKVKVDGKLKEWANLIPVSSPVVNGRPFAHSGEKDASFAFATSYDKDYFYAAVEVMDDEMIFKEKGNIYSQDGAFVQLDARPIEKVMNGLAGEFFKDWTVIGIAPNEDGSAKVWREKDIPKGTKYACQLHPKGYTIEIAIPMEYVRTMQGDNWQHLRVNVGVHDVDKQGEHDGVLFWMPDWRGKENVIGSGMLERK